MRKIKLDSKKQYSSIHFIGIGGISMRGLAEILAADGYRVSGSDRNASDATEHLTATGITVYIGHDAAHIAESAPELVVYTAAVPDDNPELVAAHESGIDIMTRSELLGRLMKNYRFPVCVAGTHGKTTATSMTAEIFLRHGGMDGAKSPTIMNGGFMPSVNGTFKKGSFEYIIAESCEYYNSFLDFYPFVGIILNVELDHIDFFKDYAAFRGSFRRFAELVPKEGAVVVFDGVDDLEGFVNGLKCNVITFGRTTRGWHARNISYDVSGNPTFDAYNGDGLLGAVKLAVPGEHNILNALAAIAAADFLGVSSNDITESLAGFGGTDRRFQFIGNYGSVKVFDDYAHHPTEIKATLAAAKNMAYDELWAVFQPHTHTRTKELLEDFADSFGDADKIIILDIYNPAGREEENCTIHSRDLAERIKQRGGKVFYCESFNTAVEFLKNNCINNDMLITMGAGDVFLVANKLISPCQ